MNGSTLTLGLVAALAAASTVRRGSRSGQQGSSLVLAENGSRLLRPDLLVSKDAPEALVRDLERLAPSVRARVSKRGHPDGCSLNAVEWASALRRAGWKAEAHIDGLAVTREPFWNEDAEELVTSVGHDWTTVVHEGRGYVVDGSVGQFEGQRPTYYLSLWADLGSTNMEGGQAQKGFLLGSDGKPRVLYHQTRPQAQQAIRRQGFRLDKVVNRSSDREMPDGVFLKPTADSISVGGRQISVVTRVSRTLRVRDRDELRKWLFERSPEYVEAYREALQVDDLYDAKWKRTWDNPPRGPRGQPAFQADRISFSQKLDSIVSEWKAASAKADAEARRLVTRTLRDAGYDSLWMERDEGTRGRVVEAIVVLDPKDVEVWRPWHNRVTGQP